jgi:enoyl-CoA hydratase/carnithine racemase
MLYSTATKPPRVETTIDSDGICHVVLNREDKLNSLDLAMFEAIAKTASELRTDRSIRAVIMSGKGRAFCTGLDVVSRKGNYDIRNRQTTTDFLTRIFFLFLS